MNTTAIHSACTQFYAADPDISGIGIRGSTYVQAILTLSISIFAASNEFASSSIRLSIVSSFAINLTLLIGRCRQRISPKNMTTGVHLAGVLWAAAVYSIGYRIQKYRLEPQKLLVVGVVICFILEYVVSCALGHCLGTWNASPSYPCEGAPDYLPPKAWCITVGVICLSLLPMIFFIWVAILRCTKWLTVRGFGRTFLLAACGSLLALIATNEVLIQYSKGHDNGYSSEALEWGLGQIVAMILIAVQILDVFTYFRPPCENSKTNSGQYPSHPQIAVSPILGVSFPESTYAYMTLLRQNRIPKLERLKAMRSAAVASGSLSTTVGSNCNAHFDFEMNALSYEYLRRVERKRIAK